MNTTIATIERSLGQKNYLPKKKINYPRTLNTLSSACILILFSCFSFNSYAFLSSFASTQRKGELDITFLLVPPHCWQLSLTLFFKKFPYYNNLSFIIFCSHQVLVEQKRMATNIYKPPIKQKHLSQKLILMYLNIYHLKHIGCNNKLQNFYKITYKNSRVLPDFKN